MTPEQCSQLVAFELGEAFIMPYVILGLALGATATVAVRVGAGLMRRAYRDYDEHARP